MKNKKILLYDIETSPNISAVWGKYEQNTIWNEQEWYMLSFAYKWLGEKKAHVYSLPMFDAYKKDQCDDSSLVLMLHTLMDLADVVVGHNSDKFDNRKANARFIFNGIEPPSSYRSIDTLKVARRYFKFDSNKLNDLGEHLNVGKKVETGGYKLWKGCLENDKKSWKLMEKYNIQDVELLEQVYLRLRPWMTNHPSIRTDTGIEHICPKCGSTDIHKEGFKYTKVNTFQRWKCDSCRGWSQSRIPEKEIKLVITN